MEPEDSQTDPAPEAAPGEPARPSRRRVVLIVVSGLLLVVCAVGSGVGYVLYDRATKLDRSSPAVVLLQYLEARFEQRDTARADLFVCDDSALAALDALFGDVVAREDQFGVDLHVDMADPSTDIRSSTAVVEADLLLWVRQGVTRQQEAQPWTFTFVDDDGWRLCGAERRAAG